MTVAELILSYLKIILWPGVVLIVIVMFRGSIGHALSSVQEFEGFGLKAKLSERVIDAAAKSRRALDISAAEASPYRDSSDPEKRQAAATKALRALSDIEASRGLWKSIRYSLTKVYDWSLLNELNDLSDDIASVLHEFDLYSRVGEDDPWPFEIRPNPVQVGRSLCDETGVDGWQGVLEAFELLGRAYEDQDDDRITSHATLRLLVDTVGRARDRWYELVFKAAGPAMQRDEIAAESFEGVPPE